MSNPKYTAPCPCPTCGDRHHHEGIPFESIDATITMTDTEPTIRDNPKPERPMKLTVVESPLAGDFSRNQRYARLCCLDCLRRGESPYASHLFFTQMLDDRSPEDRDLGIKAGFAWGVYADLRAFYTDLGWSIGMERGLEECHERDLEHEERSLPPDLMAMLDSGAKLTATPGAHE